jgi:hypothetical protein
MCVYLARVRSVAALHPRPFFVTISSRIAAASVFFMAVALFYAPLAYGCTRPEMLPMLYVLLGEFIVLGVASMIVEGGRARIPRVAAFCVAAILIQGWWLTWNPSFVNLVSDKGGIVDTSLDTIRAMSLHSMIATTLLLGSFLVLCGIFSHSHSRRFVLLAAALSGAVVSLCGIVLKLGGDPLMHYVWRPTEMDWTNFAFYRYHANAGAFLNLAWPFILVFTRRAYTQQIGFFRRAVWTAAALACFFALLLNASKASLAIGLLILPWPFSTGLARMKGRNLFIIGAAAIFLIAGGLFASSHLAREAAFKRMTDVSAMSSSLDGRWMAYQEYVNAVPEVGAFGLGPGLFSAGFPYQTSALGNISPWLRSYAHEDYLQGILEWGWFGVVWWTVLLVGGLYRAFRTYFRREMFPSKTDRHLVMGAILAVLGTMAQAFIDFPLQIVSIRLFFLVALALCWVSPKMLREPERRGERRRHFWIPVPAKYAREPAVTTSSREP